MLSREPEPAPGGYTENGLCLVEIDGEIVLGERLVPATDLPSIDTPVLPAPEPDEGWPDEAVMVEGRPVLPLDPAHRRQSSTRQPTIATNSPRLVRGPRRRCGRSPRPGRRTTNRRSGAASRDGPSEPAGGDGDPPLPAPARVEPRRRHSEPSSSQQGEGFFGAWSVGDHGIDTVSYAFRPPGRRALDAWARVPSRRLSRRERGESLWATQAVNGIKLGVFPKHGLFLAEGRLAPMLSGDSGDMRLAPPATLTLGAKRARDAFRFLGVDVGDEPVMRRLDLAGEIRFTQPSDGLLLLETLGGLRLPGLRQERKSSGQRTNSVAWSPGRSIAFRLYDAGAHHRTDPPGVRLRLEVQLRYRKSQQARPESFTPGPLAELYARPLAKLIGSAPSMNVLAPRAAERLMIERAKAQQTSLAVAERLIGVARITELAADSVLYDSATASRRHRELRQNGLILDPCADDGSSSIDVRAVLVALYERWHASA